MRKLWEKNKKELVDSYSDVIDINEDMTKEDMLALVLDYETEHFDDEYPFHTDQFTEEDYSDSVPQY
jgi:hypothetical protein